MKKVLLITYYFPPSGGAGVQRWLKTIKYLPEFGVEPIVLTVDPNVASYPQVDTALCNEVPDFVKVYRTTTKEILSLYKRVSPQKQVPYGGFANEPNPTLLQKISRFIRGNFFLPDPRKGWNKYALAKAKEIIEQEEIETIITTSPPHSTQLIGLELKRLYPHIKWVADLRDPWTDIYYNEDLYPTRLAKKRNLRYECSVLQNADQVITVSEECRRLFAGKSANAGTSTGSVTAFADKISVIPNGFDLADFIEFGNEQVSERRVEKGDVLVTDREQRRNVFTLTYVGVMAPQYDLQPLKSLVQNRKDIMLRFVGVVSDDTKKEIESWCVCTEFVPYVSHAEAIAYMRSADALILFIPNVPNNEGILTGKLFEYLASERNILLFGPENGDAMKLISECEAGCCYTKDFNLDEFLTMPYLGNGNLKNYSRKTLAKEIASLL